MATAPQVPENHLSAEEARWFAVYTRYKREKQVLRHLQEKGIEAYLPLQTLKRYYTRKIKTVELPLLSCYIFVKIKKKEYVPVLETLDVVSFVKIRRNLIAIPEREINILRMVCGEDLSVEVDEQGRPQCGDQVEIIGGRLTGMQGVLVEAEGSQRFVVELETLGYALRMEVPPAQLRRTARQAQRQQSSEGLFDRY